LTAAPTDLNALLGMALRVGQVNLRVMELLEAALAAPGFSEDAAAKTILTGFGHNAVLNVAETVINAVKAGAIRHFFLVGGGGGGMAGPERAGQRRAIRARQV